MDHLKRIFTLLTFAGLLGLCGCFGSGSDIGLVTGTVTIDGEPVEQAVVSFLPTTGRGSVGMTDADGVYTLGYVRNVKGALIGNHRVMIQTDVAEDKEEDYDFRPEEVKLAERKAEWEARKAGKKKKPKVTREKQLPKKYSDRKETELTAVVKSGTNTIDFDLVTK